MHARVGWSDHGRDRWHSPNPTPDRPAHPPGFPFVAVARGSKGGYTELPRTDDLGRMWKVMQPPQAGRVDDGPHIATPVLWASTGITAFSRHTPALWLKLLTPAVELAQGSK